MRIKYSHKLRPNTLTDKEYKNSKTLSGAVEDKPTILKGPNRCEVPQRLSTSHSRTSL